MSAHTYIETSPLGRRVVGPLADFSRDARLVLRGGVLLINTVSSEMGPQRAENMARELQECVDAMPALAAQL